MDEEATEQLFFKKEQIVHFVSKNRRIPDSIGKNELMSFTEMPMLIKEKLKDTLIYNASEDELLPNRQLVFSVSTGTKYYKATISQNLFESDDLVETILFSFCFLSLLLIITLLAVNAYFSKKAWKPFYETLAFVKDFEIPQQKEINLPNSSVQEFNQLNEALNNMMERIVNNFNNLRTFTENASHELQTPLAIIKSKTDLLLQSENIQPEHLKHILDIDASVNRLKKLNQALLLLSKIENNQFHGKEKIDLLKLIDEKLEHYGDLIRMKSFTLEKNATLAKLYLIRCWLIAW